MKPYPRNRSGATHLSAFFCTALLSCALLFPAPGPFSPSVSLQAAPGPGTLLRKAEEHFFKKRFHIARRLLLRVIQADPENHKAYAYLGDIYLLEKKLNQALENFRIAAELSPRPAREYFRLGQTLYLKEDARGALGAYKKAYKLEPQMHSCLFQMGMVELELRRNKKNTIAYWESFRRLAPRDPQGPDIDRALAILKRKGFKLPPRNKSAAGKGGPGCAALRPCVIVKGGKGGGGIVVIPGTGKSGGKTAGKNGTIVIPEGSNTSRPDKKAGQEKEKVNNKTETVINGDDI